MPPVDLFGTLGGVPSFSRASEFDRPVNRLIAVILPQRVKPGPRSAAIELVLTASKTFSGFSAQTNCLRGAPIIAVFLFILYPELCRTSIDLNRETLATFRGLKP